MTNKLQHDPGALSALREAYEEEVRYADREFGRFVDLLRYLGLFDDALVVFAADHGEEFGEHGGLDHGRTVFEEQLRVPLIIKLPKGRRAGTKIGNRVSLVDVFPSILDALGMDPPEGLHGTSILDPSGVSAHRVVAAEIQPDPNVLMKTVDLTALGDGNLKCIFSGLTTDRFGVNVEPWRTFDLDLDPLEKNALPTKENNHRVCVRKLASWLDENRSFEVDHRKKVSKDAWERLKSLGYVN